MRLAAGLALLALATGVAAAPPRGERDDPPGHQRRGYADPSAVIRAEIAFKQLAQQKGQWTAWLATAAPEAQVFALQLTGARDWLKGRANPLVAAQWDTQQVWLSCDGSVGVTRGAWRDDSASGQFVTVWQRQPRGGYKWVLRKETPLVQVPAAPEMLSALVADCDGAPPPAGDGAGTSADGTLRWTVSADAIAAQYWKDGAMRDLFAARP